jgi:glutamate formiminotransferase/formiminotetrahydrofolate cyclodeaminase
MKLFECVPNFSEGRDKAVIEAIVQAAGSVRNVTVLDIESNTDHNRSVLTLLGEGEPLKEAAFRATKKAVELIDLTKQKGEHPRMGAMDVVPFVPLGEATMEDAAALAYSLGERIYKELQVPVYFYGKAAKVPERADLAVVRKGEFEGLRDAVQKDPSRRPDVGENKLHPTAGAIAVGSRPILIAYNIYLSTSDVNIAKKVAKAIRGRDGGLAEVKALGFDIKERNRAQVSMNMTDYRRTPLHRAFEMVRSEAGRYGVGIEESEVVGLATEDALLDAAEHYLQLNTFDRKNLLERKLNPGSAEPKLFREKSASAYLDALAARKPTPGGGSASALVGAMGVALGEMVLRYSAPADKLSAEVVSTIDALGKARSILTVNIDMDVAAYDEVVSSKKALKASPQDEAAKKTYHKALEHAAAVPLAIAESSKYAKDTIVASRSLVKAVMISDYTAAVAFLDAALKGALANVEINIVSLKEEGIPTETLEKALAKLKGGA